MIEKHYSVKEVAKQLSVSTRTVRRLLELGTKTQGSQGIRKFVKLHTGIIRIPASSVTHYLEVNNA
tara:strand:+ start:1737 stop:1934 length:198 start_codon:yes stop_codon:yes gene_type:complete